MLEELIEKYNAPQLLYGPRDYLSNDRGMRARYYQCSLCFTITGMNNPELLEHHFKVKHGGAGAIGMFHTKYYADQTGKLLVERGEDDEFLRETAELERQFKRKGFKKSSSLPGEPLSVEVSLLQTNSTFFQEASTSEVQSKRLCRKCCAHGELTLKKNHICPHSDCQCFGCDQVDRTREAERSSKKGTTTRHSSQKKK